MRQEWASPLDVAINELVLEKLRFASGYRVPERALVLSRCPELETASIVFRLGMSFFGKKSTYHVIHPRTWWDWFKERWFPDWFLRRFPLEHAWHTIDAIAVLPEFPPEIGPTLRLVDVRPVKYLK